MTQSENTKQVQSINENNAPKGHSRPCQVPVGKNEKPSACLNVSARCADASNCVDGDNFLGSLFAFSPGIEDEHAFRIGVDTHNARVKVPGTAFSFLAMSCSLMGSARSQCRQPKNKRVQKLKTKKKVSKVRGPNLPTSPSTKATRGFG